ncbi:hypothetical protein [Desulfolithobacter sp.]
MGIEVGACVITDGHKTAGKRIHRLFGIVIGRSGKYLKIKLANGEIIRREPHSVAKYVVDPPNWEHLYNGIELLINKKA